MKHVRKDCASDGMHALQPTFQKDSENLLIFERVLSGSRCPDWNALPAIMYLPTGCNNERVLSEDFIDTGRQCKSFADRFNVQNCMCVELHDIIAKRTMAGCTWKSRTCRM